MTGGSASGADWDGRSDGHPVLTGLVLVIGCICLALGIVMVFARVELIDGSSLRDRSLVALDDSAVRHEVSRLVADEVQAQVPAEVDPTHVRTAVDEAVKTPEFRTAFGSMVLASRDAVLNADGSAIDLPLNDAIPAVRTQVDRIDPALGAHVEQALTGRSIRVTDASDLTTFARIMRAARVLTVVLPIVAVLSFALALVLARRSSAAVLGIGLATAIAGGLVALATVLGRSRVGDLGGDSRGAAMAIWDALMGDLRTWGIVVALVGAVIMLGGVVATLGGGRRRAGTV